MSRQFTIEEEIILRKHFTNVDGDVFALTNLPEVTKAALYARYSRSHKSLRRLFLDEFNDVTKSVPLESNTGVDRSETLFGRVLAEYGDDSVAQLSGVHIAFENVSNIATKVIERPRLMSYLEQSTRYISFDRLDDNGNFRYLMPDELDAQDRPHYKDVIDSLFSSYQLLSTVVMDRLFDELDNVDVTPVLRATTRAIALDATRGLLPSATLSNVGVYGSAQSMEQLVLHMYAHPLREVQVLGEKLHEQLKIVVPSLVPRLDRKERREPWVSYLKETRHSEINIPKVHLENSNLVEPKSDDRLLLGQLGSRVRLVEFDRDGEAKIARAILFESSDLSSLEVSSYYDSLSTLELDELWAKYVGIRENRRHRPSRAFEKSVYKFEIETDYAAFRDLQRHRMLSCAWQTLGDGLGYFISPRLLDSEREIYVGAIDAIGQLYDQISLKYGTLVGAYCLPMAYRIRFEFEINAREAMHLMELRTMPQGHESYREVAQLMYKAILSIARHSRVANSISHVDMTTDNVSRKDSLQREAQKRGDSDNLVTN